MHTWKLLRVDVKHSHCTHTHKFNYIRWWMCYFGLGNHSQYICISNHHISHFEYTQLCMLCPALCDPMDCRLPGFSVHGILQARILGWVAILFSRGTSQPRDWTLVSCITGRFFTIFIDYCSIRVLKKRLSMVKWVKIVPFLHRKGEKYLFSKQFGFFRRLIDRFD